MLNIRRCPLYPEEERGDLRKFEKKVKEKQVMSFKFPLWKEIYKWKKIIEFANSADADVEAMKWLPHLVAASSRLTLHAL